MFDKPGDKCNYKRSNKIGIRVSNLLQLEKWSVFTRTHRISLTEPTRTNSDASMNQENKELGGAQSGLYLYLSF